MIENPTVEHTQMLWADLGGRQRGHAPKRPSRFVYATEY